MAKIISLACEVADIHRRYVAVHSALFGASSFRMMLDTLTGKGRRAYAGHQDTLAELRGSLEDLETRIAGYDSSEHFARGGEELQRVLLQYTAALEKVAAGLAGICHNLAQDEQAYRQVDAAGRSRFNADKVNYDYALSALENLGIKLNRLFSSY